jgi:hypothetical protein
MILNYGTGKARQLAGFQGLPPCIYVTRRHCGRYINLDIIILFEASDRRI